MRKCFVAAVFLIALILTACCACSNDNAGTANTGSQTWEKSDAYTLQLPQGFAAQEGENGVVNLSLKGQGVGGVQTLSYANAQSLLTMDFTKEENKATVDALAQQIAPGQQMAAMLNHTEGAPHSRPRHFGDGRPGGDGPLSLPPGGQGLRSLLPGQ